MRHLLFLTTILIPLSSWAVDVVDMPVPGAAAGSELESELTSLSTKSTTKNDGDAARTTSTGAGRPLVSAKERKEAVVRTISQNFPQLKQCYEQGLKKNSSLQGKMVFSWGIEDSGKVSAVEVQSSEIGVKDVEKCMVDKLSSWVFPSDARLKSAKDRMTYTFHFVSDAE